MVSSQSVVGNRKPKLFSQLNELYGSVRTVRRANDNYTGRPRRLGRLAVEIVQASKENLAFAGVGFGCQFISEAGRAEEAGCGVGGVVPGGGQVAERNESSARLARRLGMRQEARLVRNEFFKGEWSTELDFAMLADEWYSRQQE
jgi:hypothetical protein